MADLTDEGIPELEGWMTLPGAARELGITRTRVHQLAKAGAFETIHRIGEIKIVRTVEVAARKTNRALAEEERAEKHGEAVE
jgi:hypothetical protein